MKAAVRSHLNNLLANRVFVMLLVSSLFMHLATYLVIPIFPVFLEQTRHFSVTRTGIVLGVGSFFFLVGSFIGGVLSDRLGRRTVLVVGSLLQGVAMMGFGFSTTYGFHLLFSAINGMGLGLFAPTLKAMIADVVKDEERTSAFAFRGIAANVGMILGGLLIAFAVRSADERIFWYAAAVSFALAVIARLTLPNLRREGEAHLSIPFRSYRQVFKHRRFILFSLVTLLVWALYAQFALLLPLRGQYVLGSTASIGLIWTINSALVVLFQGGISRLVLERFHPYLSMAIGTLLMGAGIFSLGWAQHFASLSLMAALFVFGEMMFLPVLDTLVGAFAKEENLGVYYGISNVVTGVGSAIGSSVGGIMVEQLGGVGQTAPWIVYGLAAIVITASLSLYGYWAVHDSDPMSVSRKEKAG